ncbi:MULTISPECIES: hypothetical protein [Rhodococcus]|uniref:hypothetical protein n=1 Tax=Rhodococcus TaxID=1827 RepID=UPI0002D8B5F9|nr:MULTISPECIES: hypothetical protein [Rhodococcus]
MAAPRTAPRAHIDADLLPTLLNTHAGIPAPQQLACGAALCAFAANLSAPVLASLLGLSVVMTTW